MKKNSIILLLAGVAMTPVLIATVAVAAGDNRIPERPEGPCDVYAKGGAPCVAAHSSTRALYKSYDGPLYQVMRQSDGKTLDIGVVQPSVGDPGGYADAEAQDRFCKDTYCWLTVIYDQSGKGNHLQQAPRGGFSGQAMGGFNNVPMADWAPVTIMGHKVYGVFITAGMGLRWNDAHGTAVDDQAEGQYWVINGHHYNTGCCFDYGNAETDSRDDGDGTMETTYFGNQPSWYRGQAPGPWIMTDQENNLVGCVNPDPNDKYCADLPSISWRFVTATADGEPHHWRSMGGNAQGGDLQIMYDGVRIQNPRSSYDPMRKQGAILLGNGGDNSNGSSGTFYEGAMTAPGTFPTIETNQKVQANVVAACYDVNTLSISGATKVNKPNMLQTFQPKSTENTAVTFTNTTGAEINDLEISLVTPHGWKAVVEGGKQKVRKVGYTVAPGQTVVVTFTVTSGKKPFNGDLLAKAQWSSRQGKTVWTASEKVRNVAPVKINEFRIADGSGNQTNSFIELYNAGDKAVNISGWTLTHHAVNIPYFSSIKIPSGTKLAPKGFYLLGISNSGLSVDAAKGDNVIYVRDIRGIEAGHEVTIGTGSNAETRRVTKVISPQQATPQQGQPGRGGMVFNGNPTTLWQPLPEGPVITIPAGSNNIPVTSITGFQVGQKMAIGYGSTYPAVSNSLEKYEVVTVTNVGKPGTQAWLSADAKKGDTNIKVSSTQNITAGDRIRLDIESEGHGVEWVTVKSVGTQSSRSTFGGPLGPNDNPGTGLELEAPLKFDHSSNMPFAVNGTGITFEPATKYDHSSNEPVLPLIYALELDKALGKSHAINDVVLDPQVMNAGYHGNVEADLLFGGPTLDASRGNMTLRTDKGLIADALNYGGLVDPWLSEGYHEDAGAGAEGAYARVPQGARGGGFGASAVTQPAGPDLSTFRYPDGFDTDDNKLDFRTGQAMTIAAPAKVGDNNIKVTSVQGLSIGQIMYLGSGNSAEKVKIAIVGTAGATTISADTPKGEIRIAVAGAQGFQVGQAVQIGSGTYVISAVQAAPRRGFGGRGGQQPQQPDYITLVSGLNEDVPAGTYLTGSGITLGAPVTKNHGAGDAFTATMSTPGKPNLQ
ncbi:MAG: lamin tail domain-containing protein [Bacteroidaceae bacterium]|nr:lamin tail domain-containing protein [Bacteroidaceae bacterium]